MKWNLPLTQRETGRLYHELSRRGAFASGEHLPWRYDRLTDEELIALALLQSRYDPRLLVILVDFFKTSRPTLHPVRFKNLLREHDALPIAAVIGEFVLEESFDDEAKDFFRFLAAGTSPVLAQLFFRNLYPIGGRKMEEVLSMPLWAFKKWGFLAADPPFLKERSPGGRSYLYDSTSRLQILRNVAKQQSRFRLKDYLQALHFSVSRQQALQDINQTAWIRKTGRGKGACYRS